jgi:DNA helicase-2/ATP-dependent DNA helicase PcrA
VTPDASGTYLRDLLHRDFTGEQLAVATHPLAPLLVVAGAGSGKTAVMAARVVHLVAFHGIAPSAILGLTFTNKAAAELADRVATALRDLARGGWSDEGDDQPTVSTYHAYAAALVRDHALRIGREPQSELLTEATRWQVASRVVRSARSDFRHLTWQPSSVIGKVLALDGEMSEHLATPSAVRAADASIARDVDAVAKATKEVSGCAETARARDELLALVESYRERKALLDVIDFGDQVALAAEIAERAPEVGAGERARFGAVLLDEYQDTGVAQRRLLTALFGGGHPVTAVGDPNQAIYGWRGASVGNLARFPSHFAGPDAETPTLPLMRSFRCGPRILSVAAAVAAPLASSVAALRRPPVDVRPLEPVPDCEDDEVRVALLADAREEAAWVASSVAAALRTPGRRPRDAAVLCRRRTDFPVLHAALVAAGVPVEVVGLGGLLEMPEVADVVATLRVLVDPVANPALIRLLTGPRWRLGPRDVAALGRRAHRLATWLPHGSDDPPDTGPHDAGPPDPVMAAAAGVDPSEVVSLVDALDSLGDPASYSPEAYDRLLLLRDELRALRAKVGHPVVDLVADVVARSGLDVEIESQSREVAAARAANLAAFQDHAAGFTSVEGQADVTAFLAFLDAAADAENGLDAGGVSNADTVKLLTVHKAKGLEWPVVAVPGLVEKVFPSDQGRPRWTSRAEVLPYRLRGDAGDLPPDPEWTSAGMKAFKADCAAESDDEERRLGYVAFTRAQRLLLLSGYWWGQTRQTVCGPSTLLREVEALAGVVTVDTWADPPADDAGNPLRADATEPVPWPAPPEPEAEVARARAVDLVRLAATGALDPPVLSGRDARVAADWAREVEVLVAEARRSRSATRDVPLPQRLTASQVVLLGEDPDELARRLARPVPLPPLRASRRGTRFHAWVESLWDERPLLDDDDLPGAADPPLDDAALAALQESFLASEWGDRRPVAVEAPFELVVGGRLVRGRIDAVYADGDRYDVVDFKTGVVPRDFAAASLQLSVYRLAWAGIAGVDPSRVDAGFLYVATGTLKRPDRLLDADELAALLSEPAVGRQGALF